jgi:hypothetical protein
MKLAWSAVPHMRVIRFRYVWRTADPPIVFPGDVFGSGYRELRRHAYLFCASTEVGASHPVILEAMAAGNCVLVTDHRPDTDTVRDPALPTAPCEGRRLGLLLDSLIGRERVVLA